ncbi:Uncharacterised protein [uncultured archaeon]|nr:Uncharacterised protein [uncultured archaeon]
MKPIYMLLLAMCLVLSVPAEMPASFTEAMNNAGQRNILNVKNYDAGATLTEVYTDIEHLKSDTQVSTRGLGANRTCPDDDQGSGLEASINSNVIGKAHIAWQSVDRGISIHSRHPLIGRSVEDLTGVFSIEKFILLWSDSRPGEISVDWLPCELRSTCSINSFPAKAN